MATSLNNLVSVDVSVVVPTFRRELLVGEAIRSALSQQGVQVEVIVVDDAPGATARAAVESIDDARIHYFPRPEPSGGRPARVRNDGALHARGRYIYFLDDDDRMQAGSLATLVEALDAKPGAGMAFGLVTPFGDDAVKLQEQADYFRRAAIRASRLHSAQQLAACLVYCNPVLINSACIARRTVFEKVGGFDDSIPVCEDADFWARMALASDYLFIRKSLVEYRTGASSLMHNLAPNDARVNESYRLIQAKYSAAVGVLPARAFTFWCRVFLRN
jgi:glycosyltransferase involved in cell wall biosynthesis